MTFISIFRTVTLGLSWVFGVVIMGLAAHYTQGSISLENIVYDFEIVALFAGIISTLSLPVLIFLGATRKGAFTSKIVVELPFLFLLSILWLVTGALTATWSSLLYPFGCSGLYPITASWCSQFSGIEGISFVAWLLLLSYTATLLTYSLISHSRGNSRVWFVGVNETTFFSHADGNPKIELVGGAEVYHVYQPAPSSTPPMSHSAVSGTPVGVSANSHAGYPQV